MCLLCVQRVGKLSYNKGDHKFFGTFLMELWRVVSPLESQWVL